MIKQLKQILARFIGVRTLIIDIDKNGQETIHYAKEFFGEYYILRTIVTGVTIEKEEE